MRKCVWREKNGFTELTRGIVEREVEASWSRGSLRKVLAKTQQTPGRAGGETVLRAFLGGPTTSSERWGVFAVADGFSLTTAEEVATLTAPSWLFCGTWKPRWWWWWWSRVGVNTFFIHPPELRVGVQVESGTSSCRHRRRRCPSGGSSSWLSWSCLSYSSLKERR